MKFVFTMNILRDNNVTNSFRISREIYLHRATSSTRKRHLSRLLTLCTIMRVIQVFRNRDTLNIYVFMRARTQILFRTQLLLRFE